MQWSTVSNESINDQPLTEYAFILDETSIIYS